MTTSSKFALCSEQLLLADRFAPITSEIGFLEAELETVAKGFASWSETILRDVMRDDRGTVSTTAMTGNISELLERLLPLRSVRPDRYLFIRTDSSWVAYFDNSSSGTDAFSAVSYLAQLIGCRGVRVVAIPNTISKKEPQTKGRFGALTFETYASSASDGDLNTERTVGVVNDGGRWVFDEGGDPLPFEVGDRYKNRSVRDRFTFEMLERYCRSLNIQPFLESFYSDQALVVQISSKFPKNAREFGLKEVRGSLGLE